MTNPQTASVPLLMPRLASVLEIDDVHFDYGDGLDVLAGITTNLAAGESVAVIGPSGCGKSTLLYLVAALLSPSRGSVRLNTTSDSARHALSMVFQRDTLLPWLTVEENVRFFTRFRKHGVRSGLHRRRGQRLRSARVMDEIDTQVADLLRIVHLTDRRDAYPYQLSGGMRRRVQFLSGVAPRPQILLLDEPFSSVDEPTRIGIHQEVFEITRSLQIATIVVTHDLAEAITLCDRVIILSNRPAVITHEYTMPFGDDRRMFEIRKTPEFLEVYGRLWDALSEQIAPTSRAIQDSQ